MNGPLVPAGDRPAAARGAVEPAAARERQTAQITSGELLQGRRFVEIAHNGEVYRLQATRLGKLILTK